MDKIVFLCTGNTCRSPMAEGLFRALDGQEKTGLQAESAGLFTTDGLSASENAITAAGELGADISAHRSRVLTEEIVANAKYLVCMTAAHYDRVLEKYPQAEEKVFTFTEADISDPFGGNPGDLSGMCIANQTGSTASDRKAFTKMKIVCMSEKHIQKIAEIEQQCFHAPWSEQALQEELENENNIFLVAENNGAVYGYVGCQTVLDEGYITNVAVMPDARRQGIAKTLLNALSIQGQEKGLSFITLEVRASNIPALTLYQKQGYVQAGVRKGFYRDPKEDAILMTKYFTKEE